MNFKLTVLSGVLTAIVLSSSAAIAASIHSNNPPLLPQGTTSSHVSWFITGNATPIASPSDFNGDGRLVKTDLLEKPYYYVIHGTKVGDHYEYPFIVKSQNGVPVMSIELQKDTANHTELIAVGIPTKQALQEASKTPEGGTSATSSGSADNNQ
jgi:hypothetical protein